ncbi:putative ribonuclease H-like domain-containing protein [Tanacetum coccineum]
MALMAFSDSEVYNDKTCSNTCLKSFEALKTQLDNLRVEFSISEFNLATYKRGLASVKEQLVFYKKNEVMFCDQIAVLKRDALFKDSEINALKIEIEKLKNEKESNQIKISKFENASKCLDKLIGSQISNNSRKGVGYNVVPPPPKRLFAPLTIDLSNSGLEEFQQPEFKGYGRKASKSVCVDTSNEVKKTPETPLVEVLVSEKEKQTVFPKQQDKTARKPVKSLMEDMLPLEEESEEEKSLVKMCDKKNYVLFTGTVCFVLSSNFKLPDESQILLKIPRKNNMYSIDMKNIVPKESLTCLVAKATLDESMLWHRRLGHINFKTLNKLVKDNLVRGIKREYSVAKTPQQNGVAKMRNRTLIEEARTTLADSKLPTTFWAEAVNTACYVQNRVIIVKPHNKTPYELFRGRTPALSFMRPFGCHVSILNTLDHLGKFDGKSDDGFFVGYSLTIKAFRVYNIRTRKVEENLHIRFLKDKPIVLGDGPKWLFDIDSLTKSMNYVSVIACTNSNDCAGSEVSIGKGTSSKETDTSQDYIVMPLWKDSSLFDSPSMNVSHDKPEPSCDAEKKDDEGVSKESGVDDQEIPESSTPNTRIHKDHSLDHVIGDIQSGVQTIGMTKNSWVEAMQEELLQFKLQKVWVLVDLPKGKRAIEEGIDYNDVFAPVARIEAIRLFLAYASFMGFMVYQMDVKSAFLYGQIEEEVYVCQLLGFEDPDYPDKVYKVVKALYGLHQAPRAWYETFAKYLLDNGFHRGKIDQTLFIKKQKGDILLVQVYVDDIIFSSTKKELCFEFEKLMNEKFQMSSMGELTFFLGLQVKQKEDGIFINRDKYVTDKLKKFGFQDVRTASTPMDTEKPLLKDSDGDDVDVHLYRSMIGSLMYLTSSRPDIMFAVCACARFQVTPKVAYSHAVKRIFRYLKGKPKLGLWYPRDSPFDLVAYSNSNYAGASLDRKSTAGGCQFLRCKLISW